MAVGVCARNLCVCVRVCAVYYEDVVVWLEPILSQGLLPVNFRGGRIAIHRSFRPPRRICRRVNLVFVDSIVSGAFGYRITDDIVHTSALFLSLAVFMLSED